MFGRPARSQGNLSDHSDDTERTAVPESGPSKWQIRRATRTRSIFSYLTSFCLLVTVIFMILVELGGTNSKSSILNKIYFISIDLADVIPTSVPNASIINSIAQTLGLHDFYNVSLWGYCEGYFGQGVTDCSKNEALYWFDPVKIILGELLVGATITLPAQVINILDLIRVVSHWMFGLFLSGTCLAFVMMFLAPLAIYSRWLAMATSIFTFIAALLITVAAVIATVMFNIMRNAFTSVQDLNIGASLGVEMFVFMWIASGFAIIAALIQIGECCCCASRRDIKTGRKRGNKKAWIGSRSPADEKEGEKKARKGMFGRRA